MVFWALSAPAHGFQPPQRRRMMCRRFTRLTNVFSKNLENLKTALALHVAYYNFCRRHGTLPVWGLEELLATSMGGEHANQNA